MSRPERHYYRVGRIEHGARYAWLDAYTYFTAEGHLIYPWVTSGEARSAAKADGFIAVIHAGTCSTDQASKAEAMRKACG